MVLETQVRSRREFRRTDGSVIDIPGGPAMARRRVRTHRSVDETAVGAVAAQFGAWVRRTQRRFDTALAVVCSFLVAGAAFFIVGLVNFYLHLDSGRSWLFWLIGFGDWAVAMLIFFSFMNGPLPRHRLTR